MLLFYALELWIDEVWLWNRAGAGCFFISVLFDGPIILKNYLEKMMRSNKEVATAEEQLILSKEYQPRVQKLSCKYNWQQKLLNGDWSLLKSLQIDSSNIDDSGVKQISSLMWPQLQRLTLDRNKICSAGAVYMCRRELPKLKTLRLGYNKISSNGFEFVMTTRNLPVLQELEVPSNSISSIGLTTMPYARRTATLTVLRLSDNNIGSRGAKYLSKAQFPHLEALFLDYCQLGQQGMKHITKGKFRKLKFLDIRQGKKCNFDQLQCLSLQFWSKLIPMSIQGECPIARMALAALDLEIFGGQLEEGNGFRLNQMVRRLSQ